MIAEFDMVPVGVGTSVSAYVAEVIDRVDKSGLNYRLTPMGTILEGVDPGIPPESKAGHRR
jgi:uncharacterized protein (TIGR00106 family)